MTSKKQEREDNRWSVGYPQKEYWLLRKYNLTIDDYNALREKQHWSCAICGNRLEYGKNTHVDHDHETGKVRGILCHTCNVGLGMFQDDIKLLAHAIVYLQDNGKSYD